LNSDGTEHAVPKSVCSSTPIDPNVAAAAIFALQGVLRGGGTAASANPGDGIPIFGKTGTTDNSQENWLVTSTTKIAQATWVGNVQGNVALRSQSFQGIGGGNVKFAIVKPIAQALNAVYGGGAFASPGGKYLNAPVAPRPANPAVPGQPTAPGNGKAKKAG
ncbi:MAG TPA: penicillin-binding protein, partial [Leifsonia sp.]|nr:penicillin-binding protein [Leifsonia sp.]